MRQLAVRRFILLAVVPFDCAFYYALYRMLR